jgi:NitT/TauT family transport system ATP-binding protein
MAVLDAVNLRVATGEAIGIMAPSGAGKSTLVRVLLGLEKPDAGSTLLHLSTKDIGVVFQEDSLLPWLDVTENATLLNRLNRKPFRSEELDRLLSSFELDRFKGYFPRALSTGMKQKVALCRLFLFSPRLYVVDEGLSNIDDWLRFTICDMLRDRVLNGAALVVITHNPTDALHLCDRIHMGASRPLSLAQVFTNKLPRDRGTATRFTTAFRESLEELRKCSEPQ